jgi:CheY-like chemotaxis protein
MPAKKILLVEDDNNLREIYGARLQAEGYDIVSASDGENALALAVKEKPDLIISDIMMPKVSGFDMLDILRNAPETKDTKVIMMTALSQAEDKARADKLGADLYLVKSQVTLEDVTKAVHKILDEPTESAQEADSAAAQEMLSGGAGQQSGEEAQPQEQKPAESPAQESQPQEPISPVPVVTPSPADTNSPSKPKAEEPVKTSDAGVNQEPPAPEVPAENTSGNQTANSTSIPVNIADENDDATLVEPNLAQALEDEEKAVQEKIEDFEKSGPQPSDNSASEPASEDQTVQEQPSVENPSASTGGQSASSDDDDKKPKDPLDDRPAKKIIVPINDPNKAPNINDLIAKEEANETARVNQANEIIKPINSEAGNDSDQASQDGQNPMKTKDDFGKISL